MIVVTLLICPPLLPCNECLELLLEPEASSPVTKTTTIVFVILPIFSPTITATSAIKLPEVSWEFFVNQTRDLS